METISRNSTIFTFFPPLLRDPSSPVSIEIFFASFIPWSLLGNARIGVLTRKTDFPNLRHHVTILPEAHVLDCSDFYSRQVAERVPTPPSRSRWRKSPTSREMRLALIFALLLFTFIPDLLGQRWIYERYSVRISYHLSNVNDSSYFW